MKVDAHLGMLNLGKIQGILIKTLTTFIINKLNNIFSDAAATQQEETKPDSGNSCSFIFKNGLNYHVQDCCGISV